MKWRERRLYRKGLDALAGDEDMIDEDVLGEEESAVPLVTKAISEILKSGGEAYGQREAQKVAEKRAAQEAEARKPQVELENQAKAARKNANDKAIAARVARAKATTEKDPNGPLHKAAAEAERLAALYDADARGFEERAGVASTSPTGDKRTAPPAAEEASWVPYAKWGGLGAAVLGLGYAGYRIWKGRR